MSTNRWQRTHRSIKIPNVKLRPPTARPPTEADLAGAEDDAHFRRTRDRGVTSGAHAAADFCGTSTMPLRGVVLSFTGLPDKRELMTMAEQMGARVTANLTSDVTHLVASRPGSDKYRAAVQFHMHVVRPEWLYRIREAWLAGDDHMAWEAWADEWRLRPLEGLCIALSGIASAERAPLIAQMERLGATWAPKLVWDGSVTHIVCGDASTRPRKGVEQVVAQRTLAAQVGASAAALSPAMTAAMQLHLVHRAWLDDCATTGVLLPEAEYDALQPPTPDVWALRVRSRMDQARARPNLQRTESVPVTATITARPANDMLSHVVAAHATTSPAPASQPRGSLVTWSRESRFASVPPPLHPAQRPATGTTTAATSGLFAAVPMYVDMDDDEKTRRVVTAVEKAGGTIVDEAAQAMYAIRPLTSMPSTSAQHDVTHHWLELCLYEERVMAPTIHPALRPTHRSLPLTEARGWRIAMSGVDRQSPMYFHTCAAVQALGAQVHDVLSKQTTHLLCTDEARHGPKAQKATEWHIPLVDIAWLESLLHPTANPTSPPSRAEPTTWQRTVSDEKVAPVRTFTRTLSDSFTPGDGESVPRRRARPRRYGPTRLGGASSLTTESSVWSDTAWTPPPAPPDDEPISSTPVDLPASHVLYDDPAARREQTRLRALVEDMTAEPSRIKRPKT
ncbi:protein kinase activating protein Dpb11 [Malassezia pachydermatis]|uniref:BRCT domain-containing protein n=1 Tax=Malassezia pachydermatis TaxID=77020 RepID=A0A0M8MR05_9BASI|nr:hypothetical protein Malapachy_2858 [Malassezia pachydermatis]KOS12574.1 hypothetical protein Malapachy_2858 [Malassezia pachydermatis]